MPMAVPMRLLNVTPMLPYPGAAGAEPLVSYGQLIALAEHHHVTLVTFAGPDPAERAALGDLQELGIDVRAIWREDPAPAMRRRQRMAWLRGRDPFRAVWFSDPAMQQLITDLQATIRFDVVQVEDTAMGHYHYAPQMPAVLTEHEVRVAHRDEGVGKSIANFGRRMLSQADRRRWRAYYPQIWTRFDRVQVFTARDATAFRRLAPALSARVRVNPFGIDVPTLADPLAEQPDTLVFIGGFSHPPNVDAALWLGQEIMPLVRQRRPGVTLALVGSDPPAVVRALAGADIIVTGRVPTIEPYLARAAVVLAPLRMGGGMRLKILQALARGKAIVTTPIGAAGLGPWGDQPPLVVAEDVVAFAAATADLLATPAVRHALGRRARAFVVEQHSWAAYRRRLEAIYTEVSIASKR